MQKKKLNFENFRRWINSNPSEEAIKLNEAEQKAVRHKCRLEVERVRGSQEKYKVEKVGMWGCLPGVLSLIIIGWIIYSLGFKKSGFGGDIIALLALGAVCWFAIIVSGDADAAWEDILKCKKELLREIPDYKWGPDKYSENHISMDSRGAFIKYKVAKFISQGITAIVILALALLALEMFPHKESPSSAADCAVWLVLFGLGLCCAYLNSVVNLLLLNVRDQELNKGKWGLKFRGINYQIESDKKNILIYYSIACVLILNYHGWPFSFWELLVGAVLLAFHVVGSFKAEKSALAQMNDEGVIKDAD